MDPNGYLIALPGGGPGPAALAATLVGQGVAAVAEGADVCVSTVTTAGLTAAAAVLFAAFGCGLYLDLVPDPPVLAPRSDLVRGAVEVAWPDGRLEPRTGLQPAQVGYLLRTALATTGR